MGKKRFTKSNNIREEVLDVIRVIEKENGRVFFEIEDHITQDAAEAVAILMRKPNLDKTFWGKEIRVDLDLVDPRKCLYWLTGGDNEWVKLHNYKKPWNECDDLFVEEYDFVISWILKRSKTFGDVKKYFIEYLSLPTLYEFSIKNNII